MKILLISAANAIHTVRWVNSLIEKVDELGLVSIQEPVEDLDDRVIFYKLKYKAHIGYFINCLQLNKIIREFKPNLINTHFLSGYGTLSALSVNKVKIPYLLSMWGSDIYDFPQKSIFHKELIRWVCKKPTRLASTSYAMRREFNNNFPDLDIPIDITPFGVDTNLFIPNNNKRKFNDTFEIGIVKTLEYKYGIEYLIKAFILLKKTKEFSNSRLHIIGVGSKEEELKKMAKGYDDIIFYGRINNSSLPKYMSNWHVCVIPSVLDSESFGVSAVEASSCAIPVIVSNVGGLPEVIQNNETGLVVPKKNAQEIFEKLKILFRNEEKRIEMGKKGRERVLREYDWNVNVETMIEVYKKTIFDHKEV